MKITKTNKIRLYKKTYQPSWGVTMYVSQNDTTTLTKAQLNRCKRQRQVKRNMFFLVSSILAIFIASIFLISFSTEANDEEHSPSYKYFKSIELSEGDTLWSVANEYIDYKYYKNTDEYIKEVMKMNSLTSDQIYAGKYIIVPYYSSEFISSDTTQ